MIVAAAILVYLAGAVLLGRRLRRQRELALRAPVVRVDRDEQLDITQALNRRSSR